MSWEVTAEFIEDTFGRHSDSVRFANFCNSVVVAVSSRSMPTMPILSEKAGADGGIDGEWTIPPDRVADFSSPFALPGWNVFQFKARSVDGRGRNAALSKLTGDSDGALAKLLERVAQAKECSKYSFFTNLQLGLETQSKTLDDKLLQKQRQELKDAIANDSAGTTPVEIVDAAQLAAIVNAHPALRLTYFSATVARPWDEAWALENRVKDYKVSVPFVGRAGELNRVREWLGDPVAKVIVISGPSGMGKTRLALEVTRGFAPVTTIVDVPEELFRWDFQALASSKTLRIIIVEDPSREHAEVLSKRAVASEGVKLILTMPTDAKAPAPKLTEHESIKVLPPLQPLSEEDSKKLLELAGAVFDRQALDWILLQAGGNPEILLSAAELKDLRERSGDLKKRLYERFHAKIVKELGMDAVRTLKTLSVVHYVKYQGQDGELKLISETLDLGVYPQRILELLPDLERMGYIRRRGNYVTVIPPLFAARLVEDIALVSDVSLQRLFDRLSGTARKRFLERIVTVDLPDRSTFWDYIFGDGGPLQIAARVGGQFEHIESLARAVPERTARFLEGSLKTSREAPQAIFLREALRELAHMSESCALAMQCLEILALKELAESGEIKETKLFCECFVDWDYGFPMPYAERQAWIQRLLTADDRMRRLLGAHIVAFVTQPPQMLSGYSGGLARRLGQPPPRVMWNDVFHYMAGLVELRFELTQSDDEDVAQIARRDFDVAISQLNGHVSPDQFVAILGKMVEWSFSGKLPCDIRTARAIIHRAEEQYTENSKRPGQELYTEKWGEVLERLARLRQRFDGGDFLIRLQIATGNDFERDWEVGEQGRVYGYQKRLRALAVEAVNNPALMGKESWNIVKDPKAQNVGEFLLFLGEHDYGHHFLVHFESEIGDGPGDWRFGLYCCGLYRHDSEFAEKYLGTFAKRPAIEKNSILWPIRFIGPTPANRELLLQLILEKSVTTIDVANMFTTGRWLDELPMSEVVTILEYIAEGEKWPERAANVIVLYLHPNKALPRELIPLVRRILEEMAFTYDNSHKFEQVAVGIARTNLHEGFQLLAEQISRLNQQDWREWRGPWNPFQRHGAGEFWAYLRLQDPEKAYRHFCTLKNRLVLRNEAFGDDKILLDLASHSQILLVVANEDERNAELVAEAISLKQTGFFSFVYELLSNRPIEGKVANVLAASLVAPAGFGTPLEKEKTALRCIEDQLKVAEIPAHGRAWLERVKRNLQEAIKVSPWRSADSEPFGWT